MKKNAITEQKKNAEATELNPVYLYFRKQAKAFRHCSIALERGRFETNNIHRLRVSIKKIRAVYELNEWLTNGSFDAEKKFKNFEKIFKSTGKFREREVSLVLLKHYDPDKKFRELFALELLNAQEKLKKKIKKQAKEFDYAKLRQARKKIKDITAKTKERQLVKTGEKYLYSHFETIEKILEKPTGEKNIHSMRTDLKKAGSVINLIGLVDKKKMNKMLANHIEKAQGIIGNWHDRADLIKNLQRFIKNNKTKTRLCNAAAKKIIAAVEKENKQFLEEFIFLLRVAILRATLHSAQ